MTDTIAPNTDVIEGKINEVPSLLIPVAGKQLVIPTVSVAEMLPFRKPNLPSEHSDSK